MAYTSGTLKPVAEYPLRAGIGKFTYKTNDALQAAGTVAAGDITHSTNQYFKAEDRITTDGAIIDVISTASIATGGHAKLFVRRRPPTTDGEPLEADNSNANTNAGNVVTVVLEATTRLIAVT